MSNDLKNSTPERDAHAHWWADKRALLAAAVALVAVVGVLLATLPLGAPDAQAQIMEAMTEANGGVAPTLEYDGDQLVSIEGRFSAVRVATESDALSAVGEVAPLFGIYEPVKELEFDRVEQSNETGSTTYVFVVLPSESDSQQSAKDSDAASVPQREIRVTVDEDGDAQRMELQAIEEDAEPIVEEEPTPEAAQSVTLYLPTHVEFETIGVTSVYDATYDDQGRLTKKVCMPTDLKEYGSTDSLEYATYEYDYDELGRLTTVRISDTLVYDGKYDGEWTVTYAPDGSSMRATFKSGVGGGGDSFIAERYDDDGHLIEREYCIPTEVRKGRFLTPEAHEVYTFSNDGLLQMVEATYTGGGLEEYDGETNRIIYQLAYTPEGLIDSIEEREYESSSSDPSYVRQIQVDELGNVVRYGYSGLAVPFGFEEYITYTDGGVPQTCSYQWVGEQAEEGRITSVSATGYSFSTLDLNGSLSYESVECPATNPPLLLAVTTTPDGPSTATNLWVSCLTAWSTRGHILSQILLENRMRILSNEAGAAASAAEQPDNPDPTATVPEGYVQLEGTVAVRDVDVPDGMFDSDGTVTVVELLLDEPYDYQYEYKGTVDATASKVQITNSSKGDFPEWVGYDGKSVIVACEGLHGAIHDASFLGVDAYVLGDTILVSVR